MSRPRILVSVRGRITALVTALFAVVMVAGALFLLQRAEDAWIADLAAQDIAELDALAAELVFMDEMFGEPFPLPVGADGTSFALVDQAGVVIATTPPEVVVGGAVFGSFPEGVVDLSGVPVGSGFVVVDPVATGQASPADRDADAVRYVDGAILTMSRDVPVQDGVLTLLATSSLEPVRAAVASLRSVLTLVIPGLVAMVGLMAWAVTGRAFRPVAAITEQVDRIAAGTLDERVPVPASRDEVAHLATTMNTMLERLESSHRRQRQFVSDASHELRNPIATSRTALEVAMGQGANTDWQTTAAIVLDEQERLADLVDDLLTLTRIDEGNPLDAADVDFDDLVLDEAARPHRVPIEARVLEPARVLGDLAQLVRLVRNLVDNAARHAASRVALGLRVDDGDVVFTVDDDGPGIGEADRERVFERFVRTDDARTRDDGGFGLGLALVRSVATGHGGTAAATESPLGGARVEVRLPVAGPRSGRREMTLQ